MNNSLFQKAGLFVVVLGAVFLLGASCNKISNANADPRAAVVAQALTEKGVTFYGAFWCPHCNDQKALFGEAIKDVKYVECSTLDKRSQTPVCQQAGVSAYPTWDFGNGDRYEGVLTIDQLIERAELDITAEGEPGPVPPEA